MSLVQSLPGLWVQLLVSAALILFASNYLARHADIIAIRTGLGHSFVGVVLLATATSLPELGTGVGSITLVNAPDLAIGDAYGSNLFNLLIIGILDIFWRRGPILNSVGVSSGVVAALGIFVITITMVAMYLHAGVLQGFEQWHISPVTIVLFGAFIVGMYIIYRSGRGASSAEPASDRHANSSLARSIGMYGLAALVIIVSAIWLANIGERIAHATGWEASFVGTQFLAFSTSLPELAASFAAIRINVPQLAISNVLGSNLFNMGFILTVDDAVLLGQPIWSAIATVHQLTAALAILMTGIVIIALVSQRRRRPNRYFTYEGISLIAMYVVASVLVFSFG